MQVGQRESSTGVNGPVESPIRLGLLAVLVDAVALIGLLARRVGQR